jgi:uncharacterized protein (TIRG00374 family)
LKKTNSKWLSILLPLFLGVYLIIYQYNQFTSSQLEEIKGYFKNANYFYIFLSLFIALFGYISRAYRWKYAIEHLGYSSHFYNNLMSVCIAYFMNLTIPRSGEVSRALILKKYENVPFDKAFGTIVAERVVDLMVFLILVFFSLFFQFNILKKYIIEKIPIEKLFYLGIIGIIGFISFILFWKYSNFKIINKLKSKFSGLIEGMLSIWKMEQRWKFIFHSFFIWFTYILMFYVTVFALKETSNISIGAVFIGFIFGSLAIGFTNSGFGVYPLLISEIFLLYGIPETAGTAFGWLVWTSQTILMILLGSISFLMLPLFNKK